VARHAEVTSEEGTFEGGTKRPARRPSAQPVRSGGSPDPRNARLAASTVLSLQRSAGNRAACHLLGRGNPTPAEPVVVQRDVGLELEVQSTKLWTGPETDTAGGQRVLLPYAQKVLQNGDLYDVESDDGRFEVVTKAFKETTDGRQRLIDAVTSGAEVLLTAYEQADGRQDGNTSAKLSEVVAATGTTKLHPGDPWIGNFADPSNFAGNEACLWAKPQATAAIPLARLGDLAAQMATAQESKDRIATSFTGMPTAFGKTNPSDEADWASIHKMISGDLDPDAPKDPACRNLVTLIVHHLGEANSSWIPYPKARHTIMARTNFQKMFLSVEASWPTVAPAAGWDKWFAAQARRDLSEYVYKGGYFSDSLPPDRFERIMEVARDKAVKEDEKVQDIVVQGPSAAVDPDVPADFQRLPNLWAAVSPYFLRGPTIKEWLASISPKLGTSQSAGMGGRRAPHLPGTPEDRGMGAMTKLEAVPSRAQATDPVQSVEAPIFELRMFEGPYSPEQWPDLAAHIFDLITWINSKQKLGT
jgi:hypothetical protein